MCLSNRTRLNKAPSSWIDDYIDWLSLETCCKVDLKTNGFCLSNSKYILRQTTNEMWIYCKKKINFVRLLSDSDTCAPCQRDFHIENGVKRPTTETFDKYLSFFLKDLPDPNCAKGGKPAYSSVRFYSLSQKKNSIKIFYCTNFIHAGRTHF